jgi:hypothetical protein
MADKLTSADLELIDRARELAVMNDPTTRFAPDALSPIEAYAQAFGHAQYLLDRLAGLAERLAGEQ